MKLITPPSDEISSLKMENFACEASPSVSMRQVQQHQASTGKAAPKIVLIADDLTGTCDSSAAFLPCTSHASVWLDWNTAMLREGQVAAFSTESRNAEPQFARTGHQKLAAVLGASASDALVFQKIDSAGRGNPGHEVIAAQGSFHCAWAVCTPALPEAGRTMRRGVVHVRDIVGNDTRVSMMNTFPENVCGEISIIESAAIAHDRREEHLRNSMEEALSANSRVLLCDADSAEDLQAIVRAARQLADYRKDRILWAGSAGLARTLAIEIGAGVSRPSSDAKSEPQSAESADGVTVVFAGSPHPVTRLQLEKLQAHIPTLVVSLQEVPRLQLQTGGCVVVLIECGAAEELQIQNAWRELRRSKIRSIVLTGGDTAALVLRALGTQSILLRGEALPAVPWGWLKGGLAAGCRVITKSGGLGSEMALVTAALLGASPNKTGGSR